MNSTETNRPAYEEREARQADRQQRIERYERVVGSYSSSPRFTYTERRDNSRAYPRWFHTWTDDVTGESIEVEATYEGLCEVERWRRDLEEHRS